ncbi:hypothetical protein BTJ68_15284 [Hortaea werneckii EXF-2000]|uniref:Uncharacterized protein n=1 Tax=Hortaea werneckii EXF-2000 TaxID=1157616 RepID=A0A1Z5SM12_HORWE|nr:hypothetical protein BTJ68_15284 [Hortaea werneckii EXF-2000]
MDVVKLETGWSFKQTDAQKWHPVARVPTNVHLDLLDNKLASGVAKKTWTYKVTLPPIVSRARRA